MPSEKNSPVYPIEESTSVHPGKRRMTAQPILPVGGRTISRYTQLVFRSALDTIKRTIAVVPLDRGAHLHAVQILRGLASLWVCWYHFVQVSGLDVGIWRWTGAWGYLGVQIFFVISGFILPYSMWSTGYTLKGAARFIWRRFLRLEPPYLASIVIAVVVLYLSTKTRFYAGGPFSIDWKCLAMHIGYLNAFYDQGWLLPVYWTLAIEFQFYILLCIVFPLLSEAPPVQFVLYCLAGLSMQIALRHYHGLLPAHIAWFVMGFSLYRLRRGHLSRGYFLIIIFAACLTGWYTARWHPAAAGLFAVLVLYRNGMPSRVLEWLGDISYSLYLVHFPIGVRICKIAALFLRGSLAGLAGGLLAALATILIAWGFYELVERPSLQYARRIKVMTPSSTEKMAVSGAATESG